MPVLFWDRVARALTISAYDSSLWRMQQAEQRCYPYGPAQRRNQRMARKLKSVASRGMANLRCERHEFCFVTSGRLPPVGTLCNVRAFFRPDVVRLKLCERYSEHVGWICLLILRRRCMHWIALATWSGSMFSVVCTWTPSASTLLMRARATRNSFPLGGSSVKEGKSAKVQ